MADRITPLRARQGTVLTEMETIVNTAANDGDREMTAEEASRYDALRAEDDRLTANIAREVDLERRQASAARPIAPLPGNSGTAPGTVPAQAADKLEPGVKFSRFVRAVAATKGKGGIRAVSDYAEKTWGSSFALQAAENMQESVDVQGGFLVNEDYSNDLIDVLRPAVAVRRMGAVPAPMPNGNMTMRKKTGTTSAQWVGERKPIMPSAPTVGVLKLSAKKLAGLVPIANDLLRFNSISSDAMVRDDIVTEMSVAEDQTFLRGAGSEFSPIGLRYMASAANIIAASAVVSVQSVRNELSKLRLGLSRNNVPMRRCGYIINPTLKEFLEQLQISTGALAFPEISQGRIGSYPFTESTSVPDNLGDAGNQSEIYFADFSQIMIGDAVQTTLAVSTEASYVDSEGETRSAFQNDETLVRVIEHVDIGTRYDSAISVLTGAAWFPGAVAGQ